MDICESQEETQDKELTNDQGSGHVLPSNHERSLAPAGLWKINNNYHPSFDEKSVIYRTACHTFNNFSILL